MKETIICEQKIKVGYFIYIPIHDIIYKIQSIKRNKKCSQLIEFHLKNGKIQSTWLALEKSWPNPIISKNKKDIHSLIVLEKL